MRKPLAFFGVKEKTGIKEFCRDVSAARHRAPDVNGCLRNMIGCPYLRIAYVDYE
jgi:hypothetical protein